MKEQYLDKFRQEHSEFNEVPDDFIVNTLFYTRWCFRESAKEFKESVMQVVLRILK